MGNTFYTGTQFSKNYTATKHSFARGTFAKVKKCVRIVDNQEFAVKIVKKKELTPGELCCLRDEIEILTELKKHRHPHIIDIEDVFENERKVKIVFELCEEYNLLQYIYFSSPKRHLTEKRCANIIFTIAKTIKYLHDHSIIHRDIKPENCLFTKDGVIKLADFGCAIKLSSASDRCDYDAENDTFLMNTFTVGTPLYVAPEILSNTPYSHMVDLWSLGVILYVCLSGDHPFWTRKSLAKMYHCIIFGEYTFTETVWQQIDNEAIELVKGLLTVDVQKRLTCEQVMKHNWVVKNVAINKLHFK